MCPTDIQYTGVHERTLSVALPLPRRIEAVEVTLPGRAASALRRRAALRQRVSRPAERGAVSLTRAVAAAGQSAGWKWRRSMEDAMSINTARNTARSAGLNESGGRKLRRPPINLHHRQSVQGFSASLPHEPPRLQTVKRPPPVIPFSSPHSLRKACRDPSDRFPRSPARSCLLSGRQSAGRDKSAR
jgi:hypothetical protein